MTDAVGFGEVSICIVVSLEVVMANAKLGCFFKRRFRSEYFADAWVGFDIWAADQIDAIGNCREITGHHAIAGLVAQSF